METGLLWPVAESDCQGSKNAKDFLFRTIKDRENADKWYTFQKVHDMTCKCNLGNYIIHEWIFWVMGSAP